MAGAFVWPRASDPQLRRLIQYNVLSPCIASGFPLYLAVFNDQDQLGGIGGDETLLIALPQRYDGGVHHWRGAR
jgi:hypothetical protein